MSEYFNQVNCNISEVVRLTFNEVMPGEDSANEIIVLCCHYEFLKALRDTISETISQHEKYIAEQKEKNKGLN